MCGLTIGGSDECWWDCRREIIENRTNMGQFFSYMPDPSCLTDCYPSDHCLSLLLADYKAAGGICRGSLLDVNYPGLFPVSNQACEVYEESSGMWKVRSGLCSERTQELLSSDQQNCIQPLFSQKNSVLRTAGWLVQSLCDDQTFNSFSPRDVEGNTEYTGYTEYKSRKSKPDTRFTPIDNVVDYYGGLTLANVPDLHHTKHRYPWICSLRKMGQPSSHICGVTLLSRPPGPTVLVTSAHCVHICKSQEGRIVPNCCCPNVGPGLCTDMKDCGTNATTVEITGAEAEIICGEWDTASDTEENYNIILPIKKIIIHPEFNISRGEENSQFVANDISVIQVDDRNFGILSRIHKINPACLPTHNNLTGTTAIHSGWSKPPPKDYVTTVVPQYEEYYGEFSKQWHYAMNITTCQDPQTQAWTGVPLKHPSNSSLR